MTATKNAISNARIGPILLAGALLLVATLAGCNRDRQDADSGLRGWNLLLITLDTTRQDRLGCYGHERARTRTLDRLADDGVVFESAVANCPITLPSHASILTGTYPSYNRVRGNTSYALPEQRVTLAEILRGAGYQTAAVLGAFVLDRRYGLDQGFDLYDDEAMASGTSLGDPERRAARVSEAALAAAGEFAPERPYFLWVHYFDPHAPFQPPPEFAAKFPADLGGLYDAEIAATDHAIGQLLDGLEGMDLAERTLIVVVGDHGEGFAGPHEEKTHGLFLYGDTLNIPLILHAPPAIAGSRRVASLVRQIDILPTVLGLLEIEAGEGDETQGASFADLLRGVASQAPEVVSYSETLAPWDVYGWAPLFQIRKGSWTFIDAPTPELYDLSVDPAELKNLAKEHPDRVAEMRGLLERVLEQRAPGGEGFDPSLVTDPEEIARLRSLGYVVPSAGELPTENTRAQLKDPKEWLHLHEELSRAQALHQKGSSDEAVRAMEAILEQDPQNHQAHAEIARFLAVAGRIEDAVPHLRKLTELSPLYPDGHFRLGSALKKMAAILDRDRRPSDAKRYRDEAIRSYEEGAVLEHIDAGELVNLGVLYLNAGRNQAAEEILRRCLKMDRRIYEAYANLGLCLTRLRKLDEAGRVLDDGIAAFGNDKLKVRKLRLHQLNVFNYSFDLARASECLEWLLANFPNDENAALYREKLDQISRMK